MKFSTLHWDRMIKHILQYIPILAHIWSIFVHKKFTKIVSRDYAATLGTIPWSQKGANDKMQELYRGHRTLCKA